MRVLLVLVVLLAGCSEVFFLTAETDRAFTCDFLAGPALLRVVGAGVEVPVEAAEAAALELSGATRVPVTLVVANITALPDHEARVTWAEDTATKRDGRAVLSLLLVERLAPHATGERLAPGRFVLGAQAIEAGAENASLPMTTAYTAVMLHFAGHALGQVNSGVPVQNPAIQEREDPMHPYHEPHPASLMHHGWEDARTFPEVPRSTYSFGIRADWAAATAPGGVCT